MRSKVGFPDGANQLHVVSQERWAAWTLIVLLCVGLILVSCAAPPPPTMPSATAIPAAPTALPTTTVRISVAAPTAAPTVAPTSAAAEATPMPTTAPAVNPTVTVSTAPELEVATPPERNGMPQFSDVAARTPADVVAYLQGRLSGYAGSGPESEIDFSPSDILETIDTAVLDTVQRNRGDAALHQVYDVIARSVLDTLRDEYGDHWVLVALDAGHGGKKGIDWDPGSEGTEALHTRGVVAAMQRLAQEPQYRRIILRPIFNDDIANDFGLTAPLNRPTVDMTLMRQTRASMLAAEAAAWNRAHPDPKAQVMVHEISVHFNVGAGGALVLHQGSTVRPEFVARSVDFGRRYLQKVTGALNATGLLPSPLRLWGDDGLHDDVMMYRPSGFSSPLPGVTMRYGALQGHGYLPRYIGVVLAHSSGG